MSLRARLTSFVAGFGLAGGATFYQLHKDITAGTQYLSEQVRATVHRSTRVLLGGSATTGPCGLLWSADTGVRGQSPANEASPGSMPEA